MFRIQIRMDQGFFADPDPGLKNLDPSIFKLMWSKWWFWYGFGGAWPKRTVLRVLDMKYNIFSTFTLVFGRFFHGSGSGGKNRIRNAGKKYIFHQNIDIFLWLRIVTKATVYGLMTIAWQQEQRAGRAGDEDIAAADPGGRGEEVLHQAHRRGRLIPVYQGQPFLRLLSNNFRRFPKSVLRSHLVQSRIRYLVRK